MEDVDTLLRDQPGSSMSSLPAVVNLPFDQGVVDSTNRVNIDYSFLLA